jgi:hypothetical protein
MRKSLLQHKSDTSPMTTIGIRHPATNPRRKYNHPKQPEESYVYKQAIAEEGLGIVVMSNSTQVGGMGSLTSAKW